jgi:hypothetical protein
MLKDTYDLMANFHRAVTQINELNFIVLYIKFFRNGSANHRANTASHFSWKSYRFLHVLQRKIRHA